MTTREANGQTWDGLTATCHHCSESKTASMAQLRRGDDIMPMVPCQGSDTCTEMLCESCRRRCNNCGLPTCGEHLVRIPTEHCELYFCEVCRAEMAEDERLDLDLEEQLPAAFAQQCAEAGVSLDEYAAAAQEWRVN